MQSDLTGRQIDLLAGSGDSALLEIDDTVLTEWLHRRTGLRVERDEAITGRHVQHAVLTLAVGPVRQAAAGELSGRGNGARAFELGVHPDQLARVGPERKYGPPRPARGVQHPLHGERRTLELELRTGAKIVGFEAPRDLELVEIGRV